jgi:radical SAM-linked protein
MKAQRLRVTFTRGEDIKYITHLDLMRFWERALRRAGAPVAYSEGFSPHAQISLAAPLPVGTTSEAELMDVFLAEHVAPRSLMREVAPQLPPAIAIRSVEEVGLSLPALQADVRFAEYDVEVGGDASVAQLAIDRFLPRRACRGSTSARTRYAATTSGRSWRASRSRAAAGGTRLRMRLRNDNNGSGRPEQVVAALGLGVPLRIHRTRLVLAGTSPAREAWRKRGRFAS